VKEGNLEEGRKNETKRTGMERKKDVEEGGKEGRREGREGGEGREGRRKE
jgi:hypothetical protein